MVDAPAQRRRYRSALRARQAERTRQEILAAAADLFAERGYGTTSQADIATAAGVSVESVKAVGPKRTLLVSSFEQLFAGSEGREPLTARAPVRALTTLPAQSYLAAMLDFLVAANAAARRLWRTFRSAADSDPEIAAAYTDMLQRRATDTRQAVDALVERGLLAPDADRAAVTDVVIYLLDPAGYEHFVDRCGWSEQAYRDWLHRAVCAVLAQPVR